MLVLHWLRQSISTQRLSAPEQEAPKEGEHQILTRMTAPTNSDAETTPSRAAVVSDTCSASMWERRYNEMMQTCVIARKERDAAHLITASLLEKIQWALMHLETNIDIDGNSMADSDAALALRECLPNDQGDSQSPAKNL